MATYGSGITPITSRAAFIRQNRQGVGDNGTFVEFTTTANEYAYLNVYAVETSNAVAGVSTVSVLLRDANATSDTATLYEVSFSTGGGEVVTDNRQGTQILVPPETQVVTQFNLSAGGLPAADVTLGIVPFSAGQS